MAAYGYNCLCVSDIVVPVFSWLRRVQLLLLNVGRTLGFVEMLPPRAAFIFTIVVLDILNMTLASSSTRCIMYLTG